MINKIILCKKNDYTAEHKLDSGNVVTIEPSFIHESKYGFSWKRGKYGWWLLKSRFYGIHIKRMIKDAKKYYGVIVEYER